MKTLNFTQEKNGPFEGYYYARSGKIEIYIYFGETGISLVMLVAGYETSLKCNAGYSCKKLGTDSCSQVQCRKTVKVPVTDDSLMSDLSYSDLASETGHKDTGDILERVRMTKELIIQILTYEDHILPEDGKGWYPEKDRKKFIKHLWNLDGYIV